MSAAQWLALAACVLVGLIAVGAVILELAKDACREHYRRAGVAWESHVDQAIEVTR